jgi:hypothetical protein
MMNYLLESVFKLCFANLIKENNESDSSKIEEKKNNEIICITILLV